jgi:hypothetical protein
MFKKVSSFLRNILDKLNIMNSSFIKCTYNYKNIELEYATHQCHFFSSSIRKISSNRVHHYVGNVFRESTTTECQI